MVSKNHWRVAALFLSVLVIQMFCVYARDSWVVGETFFMSILVARTVLPLGLNSLYFKMPLSRLGLKLPKISKKEGWIYLSLPLLIVVLVTLVQFNQASLQYYSYLRQSGESLESKMLSFGSFTLSTLPPWEFLHRAFFLFTLRNLLTGEFSMKEADARAIAIPVVTSFEVLYHFMKPVPEPLGLLIASPILSWIALRTESFLIPLGLHLFIEVAFFFTITS